MKKIFIIPFFILFSSCNNEIKIDEEKIVKSPNLNIEDIKKIPAKEELKKNELNVHFDYPVIENSDIDKLMKFWWEHLIEETKIEYNEKNSVEDPELYFSFEIYKNKYLNSIVYNVEKHINKAHPEKFSKIFYIDKSWKILDCKSIFSENKDVLINLLKKKIEEKKINFIKGELQKNLKRYIVKPKVYFDKDDSYFIFDEYDIAPYSEWKIILKFNQNEVSKFLNPEIFTNLKEKKEETNKTQLKVESWKLQEEKKEFSKKETPKKEVNKKEKKYIALSFDDWPSKTLTPKLLDLLKKYNIKATFCVLWKNSSYFPEIVKREFDEWNEICNHSWGHPNLTKLSAERLKKEIENTDKKIIEITWEKPKLFRPPYWAYNDKVKKAVWRTVLMWNVDSMDWKNKNVEKNIKNVEKDLKDGSIILFHDIHKQSIETIEPLIKKLKEENYEFLTVSELLKRWQKGDFSKKVCFWEWHCK